MLVGNSSTPHPFWHLGLLSGIEFTRYLISWSTGSQCWRLGGQKWGLLWVWILAEAISSKHQQSELASKSRLVCFQSSIYRWNDDFSIWMTAWPSQFFQHALYAPHLCHNKFVCKEACHAVWHDMCRSACCMYGKAVLDTSHCYSFQFWFTGLNHFVMIWIQQISLEF